MMKSEPFPLGARWYRQVTRPPRKLTLLQVLVLRRLRDGMKQYEIANVLGYGRYEIESALRQARIMYDVRRSSSLLEITEVQKQL